MVLSVFVCFVFVVLPVASPPRGYDLVAYPSCLTLKGEGVFCFPPLSSSRAIFSGLSWYTLGT